jgi:hypothetical protein
MPACSDEQTDVKKMEIGTKVGDSFYLIEFYADMENYDRILPTAQQMIDSFQITGSGDAGGSAIQKVGQTQST